MIIAVAVLTLCFAYSQLVNLLFAHPCIYKFGISPYIPGSLSLKIIYFVLRRTTVLPPHDMPFGILAFAGYEETKKLSIFDSHPLPAWRNSDGKTCLAEGSITLASYSKLNVADGENLGKPVCWTSLCVPLFLGGPARIHLPHSFAFSSTCELPAFPLKSQVPVPLPIVQNDL